MVVIVGAGIPILVSLLSDSEVPWGRIALFGVLFVLVFPFLLRAERRKTEEADRTGVSRPAFSDEFLGGPRMRLTMILSVIALAFLAQRLFGG